MDQSVQHACDYVSGRVILSYFDQKHGLDVTSDQYHKTYREPPYGYDGHLYGYDGFSCFDSADYRHQQEVFLNLLASGEHCDITFSLQNHQDESLYSAKLYFDNPGAAFADIWLRAEGAEELQILNYSDENLRDPEIAGKALDLLYGGFLAAQIDALGLDADQQENTAPVQLYRKAMEHPDNPFMVLDSEEKLPLEDQIRQATQRTTQSPVRPAGEKAPEVGPTL